MRVKKNTAIVLAAPMYTVVLRAEVGSELVPNIEEENSMTAAYPESTCISFNVVTT